MLEEIGIKVNSDNTILLSKENLMAMFRALGFVLPENTKVSIPMALGFKTKEFSVDFTQLKITWKEEK